jgi:transposase, IS30 family
MSGGLSPQEKAELWRRWKGGETVAQIARSMGQDHQALFRVVRPYGGIAPRERCRSRLALTLAEREEISRGLCAQHSIRQIARVLGRSPSSVSREIARNTPQRGHYRAHTADQRAWDRALRPKPCHLSSHPQLAKLVARKLRLEWSPQQIAGWLAREYGDAKSMRVSHETIYKSLFIQARGVLKKQLTAHLRRGRTLRRSRKYKYFNTRPGSTLPEPISIRERPAQAEDRAVPGHWEGDLLAGRRPTHIATLVERKSRFVILVKVPSADTAAVVNALTRRVRKLPQQLRRSLTWDRGGEMARHKDFSLATDMKVYFCDPHSPWQRGSNENTNGLLRQYFPKGADLGHYSQAHLDRVALKLNQRPRETLGFRTPADTLSQYVASTP